MIKYIFYIVSIFYSIILCSNDPIVAVVKDRVITKSDFIKRAEYTIRPTYCRDDNPIHKKIVLNSLIAEKLMAIDIESFINDDNFSSDFLIGIKEQKMRELLLDNDVYSKVNIDSTLLNLHLKFSNRIYEFSFISMDNDTLAAEIQYYLKDGVEFDNICLNYLMLDAIPNRMVGYFDEYDSNIHKAIFLKELNKDDVLGPIISKDKKYLFLKVLGWTNNVLISETQIADHLQSVKDKISLMEQERAYDEFILDIMSGDKLKFFEKPFFKLADVAYKFYFNKYNPQTENIDPKYNDESFDLLYFASKMKINPDDVFLKFNDNEITVKNLDYLISKHPLLFQKKQISEYEFPLYFKYAIVDLIRDEEINKIAYNKQYDNHLEVIKEMEMFNDATLSQLHLKALLDRNNITEKQFEQNSIQILDKYLNTYIDSLQQKYFNDIKIDFNVFENLKMTRIDFHAYKKGVPYPNVVPLFPILTSNHIINYGVNSNF
tara:strand:+ start:756 stop:2222 length:1467 start_codon:yes stop_codon:yes gene_type:complete